MPYHFESANATIPNELDKRVKIPKSQYPEIKALRAQGLSQQKIADQYNVSKRTIQFILNPQRAIDMRQRRNTTWRDYYDPAKHAAYTRRYRRRKAALARAGKLQPQQIESS